MDGKIIIGIMVAAIIVLAALAFNPFAKPQSFPEDENIESLEARADAENIDGPLDVLSPEELELHYEQIKQSDPVRYDALQESNVSICEQEENSADIDWCKAAVAEKLKDETICPALAGGAANQCYNDVARATGKIELCRSIKSQDWMFECITYLASINSNLEACNEITDIDWKDTCIAQIAFDRADTSLCSKVQDTEFREDCIANITG